MDVYAGDIQNDGTALLLSIMNQNKKTLESSWGSIRRYMPGIQKYAPICTQTKPDDIMGEWDPRAGYIISPITVAQWEKLGRLEYDKFEDVICSGVEFSNLVDYVHEHPFGEKAYTKEEIKKTYKAFMKRLYDLIKGNKAETEEK